MPKVVDHEERRRHIADAVFTVVGQRGLAAAGLRDVAAEAGVSMGSVQHYFSTKEDMLLFAMDHLTTRVVARIQAELQAAAPSTYRQFLTAAMRALLPLDRAGRDESAVNIAFFAAAGGNNRFRANLLAGYQKILANGTDRMRSAAAAGYLADGVDPERDGLALFALTQGLVGPLLLGAVTESQAMAVLDHQILRLFT